MFLVTAYPRSATQFMARTLQFCGLSVGHEQKGKDGIVSWKELPHSTDYTTVFHQVRHPIEVISSATSINGLSITEIGRELGVEGKRALSFFMRSWLGWTDWADEVADCTYCIEDLDDIYPEIFSRLGLEAPIELPRVNKRVNSREHREFLPEELFKYEPRLAYGVVKKMQKYGYIN
jgi:hypothetical protein